MQEVQPRREEEPTIKEVVTNAAPVTTFHDAEREAILRALRESNGVVSGAAVRLGLRRTTLQSKMRRLGIRRPSF
jgi:formate hydrogenlyase transcriptional activator